MAITENIILRFNSVVEGGALDEMIGQLETAEKLAATTLQPLIRSQSDLNKELASATSNAEKRLLLQRAIRDQRREERKITREIDRLDRQRFRTEDRINKLTQRRLKTREQIRDIERQGAVTPQRLTKELEDLNRQLSVQRDRYNDLNTEAGILRAGLESNAQVVQENKERFVELGGEVTDLISSAGEFGESLLSLSTGKPTGREIFNTLSQLASRFGLIGASIGAAAAGLGIFFTQAQSGRDLLGQIQAGTTTALNAAGNQLIGGGLSSFNPANFARSLGRIGVAASAGQQQEAVNQIIERRLATERAIQSQITRNSIEISNGNTQLERAAELSTENFNLQRDQLNLRLQNTQEQLRAQEFVTRALRAASVDGQELIENLQREKDLRDEIDALRAASAQLTDEERRAQVQIQERFIRQEQLRQETLNFQEISGSRIRDIENERVRIDTERGILQANFNNNLISEVELKRELEALNQAETQLRRQETDLVADQLLFARQLNIERGNESNTLKELRTTLEQYDRQLSANNAAISRNGDDLARVNELLVENERLLRQISETRGQIAAQRTIENAQIQEAFIEGTVNDELRRNAAIQEIRINSNIELLEIQRRFNNLSIAEQERVNTEILRLIREREELRIQTNQGLEVRAGQRGIQLDRAQDIARRLASGRRNPIADQIFSEQERLRGFEERSVQLSAELNAAQERLRNAIENRRGDIAEIQASINRLTNDLNQLNLQQDAAFKPQSILGQIFQLDLADEDQSLLDKTLLGAERSVTDFVNFYLDERVRQADADIAIQERRVARAQRLFEKGNADSLNAEEARLDELIQKREEAAARQRQIDALAVAGAQAVSIAKTIQAITSAAANGPLGLVQIPLILGAIAQGTTFALSLAQAFGDIPAFFGGTDTNIADALGKPHMSGRDGYLVRVDGKEKVLAPEFAALVDHMSQEDLVRNALIGERHSLSDAITENFRARTGDNTRGDEILKETKRLADSVENMQMKVSVDHNGFNAYQKKRVARVNRIKRIRK